MPSCLVQGCQGDPLASGGARGFCPRHYRRHLRTGSTTLAKAPGIPKDNLPWRIDGYLLDLIRQAAELEQTTPGEWLEQVILAALPFDRLAE